MSIILYLLNGFNPTDEVVVFKNHYRNDEDTRINDIDQTEGQDQHSGGKGQKRNLSFQCHGSFLNEAVQMFLINFGTQKPVIKPLAAPREAIACDKKERGGWEHRQDNTDAPSPKNKNQ